MVGEPFTVPEEHVAGVDDDDKCVVYNTQNAIRILEQCGSAINAKSGIGLV